MPFNFSVQDGVYGYLIPPTEEGGADTFTPFKTNECVVFPPSEVLNVGYFYNSTNKYTAQAYFDVNIMSLILHPISSTLAYVSLYCGNEYSEIYIEYSIRINQAGDGAYLYMGNSSAPAGISGTLHETYINKFCNVGGDNTETFKINKSIRGNYLLIGFDHSWSVNNDPYVIVRKLKFS